MSTARGFASFRIGGESLDPLDVTKALRLPPDHSHRNGEPRLKRSPESGLVREYAPYREGMWSLKSEPWVDSAELDVHIRWLLDQLEPRAAELRAFLEQGAWADISCYSSGSGEEASPLPAVTLGRCVALSLPVEMDRHERDEADRDEGE